MNRGKLVIKTEGYCTHDTSEFLTEQPADAEEMYLDILRHLAALWDEPMPHWRAEEQRRASPVSRTVAGDHFGFWSFYTPPDLDAAAR